MKDGELQIDFRKLWAALRRSALCIAALALEGAVAAVLGALLLITPEYQSGAVFYVNNNGPDAGNVVGSISAADIAASKELVDSYLVILHSRETLEEIVFYAGVDRTWEEAQEMISASAVNATEFFEVVVTSPDAWEAEVLAEAIAQILPQRIGVILEGTSAKIVDSVVAASSPRDPGYGKIAALGFLTGLLFAVGCACVESIMDRTIRSKEDIVQNCDYPVLTVIQEGGKPGTGYPLLRAKLEYLLKGTQDTHILGVTSALRGEGKNRASENLARSLTMRGKNVLLLDCDLRASRPVRPERRSHPLGLAEYLSGTAEIESIIQRHAMEKIRFSVIPAGQVWENFAELLASEKMTALLQSFQGKYDYVILNLPVMAEAGDALALARQLHGILLTVRRDVCNLDALQYALQQMEFVDAPILGVMYQDLPKRQKRPRPAGKLAGLGIWIKRLQTACFAGSDSTSSGTLPSIPRC